MPRPYPYTVAFEKVERKQPEAAGEAVRNRMQQLNSFRTEARSMALEWMPTLSVRFTNNLTVHFYDCDTSSLYIVVFHLPVDRWRAADAAT